MVGSIVGHKTDKLSGTCGNTLSARFTCILINYCYPVDYVNRIEGTNIYAGASAETSFPARLRTASGSKINYPAILGTYILIILLSLFTVTHAGYESNLFNASARFGSHDLSNLLCDFTSAYGTSAYRSFAFYDCGRKTRAPGISASSAVISGKSIQNLLFSFIYFYFENNTGCAEEKSYEYSDACRT